MQTCFDSDHLNSFIKFGIIREQIQDTYVFKKIFTPISLGDSIDTIFCVRYERY